MIAMKNGKQNMTKNIHNIDSRNIFQSFLNHLPIIKQYLNVQKIFNLKNDYNLAKCIFKQLCVYAIFPNLMAAIIGDYAKKGRK